MLIACPLTKATWASIHCWQLILNQAVLSVCLLPASNSSSADQQLGAWLAGEVCVCVCVLWGGERCWLATDGHTKTGSVGNCKCQCQPRGHEGSGSAPTPPFTPTTTLKLWHPSSPHAATASGSGCSLPAAAQHSCPICGHSWPGAMRLLLGQPQTAKVGGWQQEWPAKGSPDQQRATLLPQLSVCWRRRGSRSPGVTALQTLITTALTLCVDQCTAAQARSAC